MNLYLFLFFFSCCCSSTTSCQWRSGGWGSKGGFNVVTLGLLLPLDAFDLLVAFAVNCTPAAPAPLPLGLCLAGRLNSAYNENFHSCPAPLLPLPLPLLLWLLSSRWQFALKHFCPTVHVGVLLEMKSSRVSTGIASQHFWLKCGIQMLFSLFFGFFFAPFLYPSRGHWGGAHA